MTIAAIKARGTRGRRKGGEGLPKWVAVGSGGILWTIWGFGRTRVHRLHQIDRKQQSQKKKRKKTYNTGYSLVVTDPTTDPALPGLSWGERTGSRVFLEVWSYVEREPQRLAYPSLPDLLLLRTLDRGQQ